MGHNTNLHQGLLLSLLIAVACGSPEEPPAEKPAPILELSTVPNNAPTTPVLSAGTGFPVAVNTTVTFTATSEDADGDELSFEWSVSSEDWALAADGATATVQPKTKDSTAVLFILHGPALYMRQDGASGEVAIRRNESVLATAQIGSPVAHYSSPVLVSRVLTLDAGTHRIDAAARSFSSSWNLSANQSDRPTLTVIVLD